MTMRSRLRLYAASTTSYGSTATGPGGPPELELLLLLVDPELLLVDPELLLVDPELLLVDPELLELLPSETQVSPSWWVPGPHIKVGPPSTGSGRQMLSTWCVPGPQTMSTAQPPRLSGCVPAPQLGSCCWLLAQAVKPPARTRRSVKPILLPAGSDERVRRVFIPAA
jgi:hypothetical protein